MPSKKRDVLWFRVAEEKARKRGAIARTFTAHDAKRPFYDLALGAIRAENLPYLKAVLAQHPFREVGINLTRSFGLGTTPADFSLMTAVLYGRWSLDNKAAMAEMLLDAGFNLLNMGRYVMGAISPTPMMALCRRVFMENIEQEAHFTLVQLFIKHGGDPFYRVDITPTAYDYAKADYPYLLHENGGPFPEPSEAYLKQRDAKGFLSMMTASDFGREQHT